MHTIRFAGCMYGKRNRCSMKTGRQISGSDVTRRAMSRTLRFQSENMGDLTGALTVAGTSKHSAAWLPKYNLHLTGYDNPNALLKFDVTELDVKQLFEQLHAQSAAGEVLLDIQEEVKKWSRLR